MRRAVVLLMTKSRISSCGRSIALHIGRDWHFVLRSHMLLPPSLSSADPPSMSSYPLPVAHSSQPPYPIVAPYKQIAPGNIRPELFTRCEFCRMRYPCAHCVKCLLPNRIVSISSFNLASTGVEAQRLLCSALPSSNLIYYCLIYYCLIYYVLSLSVSQ